MVKPGFEGAGDREVVHRCSHDQDIGSLNKRVHQIMTRRPIVLQESATVDDAIQSFNTHGISCLPVVDLNFRPVGIVTWRDILKNLRINPTNPTVG